MKSSGLQPHRLPLAEGALDLVVSQEAFEHLSDPTAALSEAVRVFKPGGQLDLQGLLIIGEPPGSTESWRLTRDCIGQKP